jgi:hypothetical protein
MPFSLRLMAASTLSCNTGESLVPWVWEPRTSTAVLGGSVFMSLYTYCRAARIIPPLISSVYSELGWSGLQFVSAGLTVKM